LFVIGNGSYKDIAPAALNETLALPDDMTLAVDIDPVNLGSAGLRPVVLGVPPETVAGRMSASLFTDQLHSVSHDGIRRDAEFNPRDAGATVN